MLPGPFDGDLTPLPPLSCLLRSLSIPSSDVPHQLGRRDRQVALQGLARVGALLLDDLFRRACSDQLPALVPPLGPEIQNVVRVLQDFQVVLHHHDGVSLLEEPPKGFEQELDVVSGVFVSMVNENSAALDAGLQQGDVITGINGVTVTNVSELQELVARNRPGDEVEVTYIRNGDVREVMATLRDYDGNAEIQPREIRSEISGAVFEELSDSELKKYDLDGGVRIASLSDGPWKDAGIEAGLIITRIDKIRIETLEDLNRNLDNKNGPFLLEGIYENGDNGIFGVTW